MRNPNTLTLIFLAGVAYGLFCWFIVIPAARRLAQSRKPVDPDLDWTACHACRELMAPGAWGVFYQGKVYCSERCIPAIHRQLDRSFTPEARARKAGL